MLRVFWVRFAGCSAAAFFLLCEFMFLGGLDPAKQADPPNGGSLWISVLVRWDRLAPGSCSGAKGVLGSFRWLLRRRIFLAVLLLLGLAVD